MTKVGKKLNFCFHLICERNKLPLYNHIIFGGESGKKKGDCIFSYKAILNTYLVIFFIKFLKVLDTFLKNSLILIVSFKKWLQLYIFTKECTE